MNDSSPVALVVGAGPGLGAALCRKFAAEGMAVAASLRDPEKISDVVAGSDGKIKSYAADASDEKGVLALFDAVGEDLGDPSLVVFNAGAYHRGTVVETEAADFERSWKVGCFAGFLVGREAARRMLKYPGEVKGTILFSSATASQRGGAGFVNLAVGKFGLKALCQSMARELMPRGIHVAQIVIDGQIFSPRYADLAKERQPDGLLRPDAIAETYWMLHTQHRSAWTLDLDVRPWVEKF